MLTLHDRVILLVRSLTSDSRGKPSWAALERASGISQKSWIKAANKQQRPTAEMIEALCRWQPRYAFWLVTGLTDVDAGHVCPAHVPRLEPGIKENETASLLFLWQLKCDEAVDQALQRQFGDELERAVLDAPEELLKRAEHAYGHVRKVAIDQMKRVRELRNLDSEIARNANSGEYDLPADKINDRLRAFARRNRFASLAAGLAVTSLDLSPPEMSADELDYQEEQSKRGA